MIETEDWASLSEQLASRPPGRRRWARVFVPDMAVCLAVLTVFCALVFFNAPQNLFRDSETAREISSRTLLGLADRAGGLSGVAWLSLVLTGVVIWLWVRFHWASGGNFFLTLVLFVPFVWTLHDQLRATSALFGWVFLVGFLTAFENAQARFSWRAFVGVAIAAAVWANVDGSFLFLPVIAVLYGVTHLLRPLIWPLERKEEWKRARWFGCMGAVALAAGWMTNPHGLRLPEASGPVPLVTLGVVCVGGVLALTQSKVAHFLIIAFFACYATPFVFLLLPMANGSITTALRRSRNVRPQLRKRVTEFLQRSDHFRLVDARFGGLLWTVPAAALLLGWLMLPMVSARTGFPRSEFPVDAVAEFAVLPGDVRVLVPPQYADYLTYRFGGRVPVFVRSAELLPGWREEIGQYGVTHALLPTDSPMAQALEALKWKPIIEDNASVLLRRAE